MSWCAARGVWCVVRGVVCGVVWCGVWCGVVWCGVWCGVVWCVYIATRVVRVPPYRGDNNTIHRPAKLMKVDVYTCAFYMCTTKSLKKYFLQDHYV